MAKWTDCRSYEGTILEVHDNDTVTVIFEDGIKHRVKNSLGKYFNVNDFGILNGKENSGC